MNRKLVFIFAVLAAVPAYFVYDLLIPSPKVLRGTFFVSDAGESHGGFEYTAEWDATLEVRGTTGALKLVPRVGLGDALEKHRYRVTGFKKTPERISMRLDGSPVELVWIEEDLIWNHTYDEHYIASWGGYAPTEEIRGTISPSIFPGLAEFWYLELRMR